LLQWAKEDWKGKQGIGLPTYIHMGDNQPYPNAPKAACEDYAGELGFEVLPAITFSLIPGNYSRQCRQLESINPDYVFLANLDKSVSALLMQCRSIGLELQYMVNIWGFDETVMQTAGLAANNVVWVMGAASWQDTVPGIYLVREISKMSDPEQEKYRSVHYLRGVCSMFYLKEAIENAMENGVLTGRSIKSAMYKAADWVPDGLDGVCLSATWREDDHRGINRVLIYRSSVAGPVGNLSIKELIENKTIQMNQVYVAIIPRRKEWLGY
jgi:branched-chain amino acid transport system substrate-binding protein